MHNVPLVTRHVCTAHDLTSQSKPPQEKDRHTCKPCHDSAGRLECDDTHDFCYYCKYEYVKYYCSDYYWCTVITTIMIVIAIILIMTIIISSSRSSSSSSRSCCCCCSIIGSWRSGLDLLQEVHCHLRVHPVLALHAGHHLARSA